jgi:hypothetical protein
MENTRRSKHILLAGVVIIVLLGGLGTLAFTMANDFICSKMNSGPCPSSPTMTARNPTGKPTS